MQNIGLKNCSIVDNRTCGCGYDFEITSKGCKKFIEVKGLSGKTGGVLFTDKEWSTALELKEDYILLVVKNIDAEPEVQLVINPAEKYNPLLKVQQIVQVNWIIKDL